MPNVLFFFPFVCFWNFQLLKPPSLLKNKKHLVGILPRLQQAYVHLKIHSRGEICLGTWFLLQEKEECKKHLNRTFHGTLSIARSLSLGGSGLVKTWFKPPPFRVVFKELLIFTSVCSPWRRSRSLPCQRYRTHSWKDQVQPKNHLRCAIFDLRWVEKSPWVATWVVAGVRMAGLANLN